MTKALLTLAEAAELTPFHEATLRRAVKNPDPRVFPFVLRAKKDSKGRLMVTPKALEDWIALLDDA